MRVLGIESSCDETAAAVVDDGRRILADVVASQVAIHARFGGVVPEIASRAHVTQVIPVLNEALRHAGCTLADIDAVAVTRGPGLVGALLVGVQTAKAIAYARGLPLVGVNHLAGHLQAIFLHDDGEAPSDGPPWPHLGLLVSGGHTLLLTCHAPGRYELLGTTRDDAAGEAFDKVGKMLGLGYPAGATIDRLAAMGDPLAVVLPRAMRKQKGLDMSFSGLKTAVAAHLARSGVPVGDALADLAASFQRVVVEQLVRKTQEAMVKTGLRAVQMGGGVAANSGLRRGLDAAVREAGGRLYVPTLRLCADNAAMIAAAGYHRLIAGERDDLTLNASAQLPL